MARSYNKNKNEERPSYTSAKAVRSTGGSSKATGWSTRGTSLSTAESKPSSSGRGNSYARNEYIRQQEEKDEKASYAGSAGLQAVKENKLSYAGSGLPAGSYTPPESSPYAPIASPAPASGQSANTQQPASILSSRYLEKEIDRITEQNHRAVEKILKDTGKSTIRPHSLGSFISSRELNVKIEENIQKELDKLKQAALYAPDKFQQAEIDKRVSNLHHQLQTLDIRAGRQPRSEQFSNSAVQKETPKSLDTGKSKEYTDSLEAYNDYVKNTSKPSVEEYMQLVRTGANIDFQEYARQKLNEQQMSYPKFRGDMQTGKFVTHRYGDVTTIENLSELYKKKEKKPQKSFVIYTSDGSSDFTRQAEYQREQLENAGKDVEMIEVNSLSEFLNAWTSMGRSADEVVILSHAKSHALIFEDGSSTEAISVNGENLSEQKIGDIRKLAPININTLTLLGCNTGNLDAAETDKGNPAQAFSSLGSIGKVVAYDGSVGYSEKGSGLVEKMFGKVYPYDWMYPRQSSEQADFWDNQYNLYPQRFIPEEMDYRNPQGQVVYNSKGKLEEVLGWEKPPKKK